MTTQNQPRAADSQLLAALNEVHAYFEKCAAMRPNINHGTEGERIRAMVAQFAATKGTP